MGEILPDGTIQSGYTGICDKCGKYITVNMQGNETGTHKCKSKTLPIHCVRRSALKWWRNLKTSTKLREFYQHCDHIESIKPSEVTDEDIEKLYRWHYA